VPVLTDSAPNDSAPTDSAPIDSVPIDSVPIDSVLAQSLLPGDLLARIHEREPPYDREDDSLDFVLRDAAAGGICAFGIGEAAYELVLFDSTTDAQPPPDGRYASTGAKISTSLSPA